jgi:hypothetical protein
MNTPKGMETDHKNGNGLDNQKSNLRIVTHRQNCQNQHINKTSKYVGLYWDKKANKWTSRIVINGKQKNLGSFDSEEEAYKSYIDKLKELGEVFVDDIKLNKGEMK